MSKSRLMQHGWQTGDMRMWTQGAWASVQAVGRFLIAKPLPGMGGKGGISTTIITTFYMVILTLAVATPLGVGAAIYLVEYAGEMGSQSRGMRKVVEIIRFAVETLAGVPSIIFGLFGFALFVSVMHLGLSMLSGALAGGVPDPARHHPHHRRGAAHRAARLPRGQPGPRRDEVADELAGGVTYRHARHRHRHRAERGADRE